MDMELNDYTTTSIIVPSIYERRASGEQRTLSTERSTIWKYVTTPLKPQLPDDNFLSEPCADELTGSNALLISARRKCTCRFLWNYELHGLTAYLRSRTVGERLLWIVIIFICMFFAVTTTHTMFSDYLEHQTATLITIKQKPRLMLPSLTICPKNPDALNYQKVIRDISKRLPRLDRVTLAQLLAFVIAGAGFNNVDAVLYQVLPNKIEKMNALFRRWKAKRSMVEFYTTLFEKHGYSCSEFFNNCYYGYHRIPCCDIFRPHYVMLRGRCFRIDNFYQSDPDALGRLTVFLNQLPSRITEKSGLQPQTVVYVSDKYPDVATFPRLYLDFHETRYIRVRSRRMVLLPWNNDCSESPDHVGRTCYVTKWLRLKVAKPLNCTVFYLRHKMPGYKVCEPVQVIRNYHIVTNTSMLNEDGRCLPACHRFDYVMKNFRAESTTPGKRTVPAFRLEISYMDLEVERYEEILTTRLPDFVSQLGGQSGLFVGMSACTVVQVMSTYQSFYEETFYIPTVDYTPIRKRRMKNMSRIPSISHEILLTDDYDSESYREGLRVQKKKCSCRFIWNYELHGLTVFLRSKGFFMQVLWGFTIAFCIIMALYTTKWVFEEYLERQTATLITFQNKPRQLLPTIAICPKNPDALNYPKVLRDIAKRFPHLDRVTVGNLIAFAIAGAGFHNMEHILSHFTKGDMDRLTALFRRWKGHRTLEEFFNDLFHKNGYRCEDMFQGCFYGYEQIPCCDVLRPYYVVLRGRCFRLDKMFQTDPDVFGRLNIYMNQLPSRLSQSAMKTGGMQPQVIVYISDKHPDVGTFPRYYINYHEAIYVRVRGRKIMMLEGNSQCSAKPEDKGKSTCFINKYIQWRLLNPLNCTVFYMRFKTPDYKVCEPEVIVKNYKMVNDIRLANDNDYKCLPACRRRDYILTLFRSESSIPRSILMRSPAFRFELSYMHLELERYEEVVTTTLPGFISQLGGQSGLFVGLSVCTLIQIAISVTTQSYRRIHIYFGGYYRGFWN